MNNNFPNRKIINNNKIPEKFMIVFFNKGDIKGPNN